MGETVTVEGVITFDARQPGGFGGFYLQQADDQTDDNPQTSEALFIYTRRKAGTPGSRVRLTGKVKEYHGLTELVGVSNLSICGSAPLPKPITIGLPWPDQRPPEHLENMRVKVGQPLTLIGPYQYARFGELTLSAKPQVIPTEILTPGPAAESLFQLQARNRLVLDDGQGARNPRPLPWPGSLIQSGQPIRTGDQLTNLQGVLDFRFGAWRLQPLHRPGILQRNPRPDPPELNPNANLRVAAMNLGNLFNGNGNGSGFPTARGAQNPAQYHRQLGRLVTAINALAPDILAVSEIENDHYSNTSAVAQLAASLGPGWQFVQTPGQTGSDAIRTDILYRSDHVEVQGKAYRLEGKTFADRGRPPVAQMFRRLGSDISFRVVSAHLKSKSCKGAAGDDKDQRDGQGCYAKRRQISAQAMTQWLTRLAEPDNFAGTLILGDLNSYAREWPLQTFRAAGFVDTVKAHHRCTKTDCPHTTYRYNGRHGSLDYSLASISLGKHVVSAGAWSINAEEFPFLNYQGAGSAGSDEPWRTSDHNPVYTDLSL